MTGACYVLPLRWRHDDGLPELTAYLRELARSCEVIVVDGSPRPLFDRHHAQWRGLVRHLRPHPDLDHRNGKVNGVVTGLREASAERVVIADDDVRYDPVTLAAAVARLDDADLVIPQNYFDPLPWHAAWDSARSLLNRAVGTDYPGTLVVRRSAFHDAGCYDGDVLFENLELIRTMRAAGARVLPVPDVLVRRLPPTAAHFAGQRVRQAYDSLAQPVRLAVELALLPAAVAAVATGRVRRLAAGIGAGCLLAELGRRRGGGTAVFPARTVLFAPAWLAERAVCSWLAVGSRLRGGVRYADSRLPRAATSTRVLRRRHLDRLAAGAEPHPGVRAVAERLEG
jgi:hypothetical protein